MEEISLEDFFSGNTSCYPNDIMSSIFVTSLPFFFLMQDVTTTAAHILGEIVRDKISVARSLVRVFSHHDMVCSDFHETVIFGSARLGSAGLGEVLSLYQVLWLALIECKCCILFAFYLGCGFSQISRRPWGAEYSVSSLFITADVMTNDLKYISSLSHLVTPLPLACDKSMFQ